MAEGLFLLQDHTSRLTVGPTQPQKQGPNFHPNWLLEDKRLKNNDRLQSQDVASEYILKEIYFTPQNKNKKKKDRDWGCGTLGMYWQL